MSLSARQQRLYVFECDVWRSPAPASGLDAAPAVKAASSVPCLFQPRAEVLRRDGGGLADPVSERRKSWFSMDAAIDVRPGDHLQITAVPNGSPDLGRWFLAAGIPQRNAIWASRLKAFVDDSQPPVGAE